MNNIHLKYGTINDIDTLANLEKSIWISTYKNILPYEYINTLDLIHIKNKFIKRLYDKKTTTYVILKVDKPIGYIVLTRISSHILEISKIYILQEYQHQGIGQYCYKTIINQAICSSFKSIEVWIIQGNQTSIDFHKKMSFKYTGIKILHEKIEDCTLCKYIKFLSKTDNLKL